MNECVPNIHYRFGGDHALSGERHDHGALRQWLERLGRIGPGLTLLVHQVWVNGFPNDTTIVVRWSATDTRVDGSPYNNHGVHIISVLRFKVVDIDANEDSQDAVENLRLQATYGIGEASAPPMVR